MTSRDAAGRLRRLAAWILKAAEGCQKTRYEGEKADEIVAQRVGLFRISLLGSSYPLEETIRRIARIGYDAIEIGAAAPHAYPA